MSIENRLERRHGRRAHIEVPRLNSRDQRQLVMDNARQGCSDFMGREDIRGWFIAGLGLRTAFSWFLDADPTPFDLLTAGVGASACFGAATGKVLENCFLLKDNIPQLAPTLKIASQRMVVACLGWGLLAGTAAGVGAVIRSGTGPMPVDKSVVESMQLEENTDPVTYINDLIHQIDDTLSAHKKALRLKFQEAVKITNNE